MNTHMLLSIFHILFVAPFFLAIAFMRSQMAEWMYNVILVTGILILFYHAYKFFIRWQARSSGLWINAIHVALVAPLLIYIGYTKKDTPRAGYELAAMTGFAALGYHLYSLIAELQIHNE
jgi:hypothetical protein